MVDIITELMNWYYLNVVLHLNILSLRASISINSNRRMLALTEYNCSEEITIKTL